MNFDKNTVIGFALMVLMLIGFTWYNAKTTQELQAIEAAKQDSLARVEALNPTPPPVAPEQQAPQQVAIPDSLRDQLQATEAFYRYGILAPAITGEAKEVVLENNKIKVVLNTKGGMVKMAELVSDYVRYQDKSNIRLWSDSLSAMKMLFNLVGKGTLKSDEFYFVPSADYADAKSTQQQLVLKLNSSDPSKYIEFVYTLAPDAYKVDFAVNVVNLGNELEIAAKPIQLEWFALGISNEKGISAERQKSSVFYRETEEDRDYLSESSGDEYTTEKKLNWMAFKQGYFSAAILSNDGFGAGSVLQVNVPDDKRFNKSYWATLNLPMNPGTSSSSQMAFYFGPNDYKELKKLDAPEIDKIIDYGWSIIGWVNKYCIRPLFWFFSSFIGSWGLIILLVTLVIKMVLFPITWKNFLSSAKMRVLKPEIDEINKKFEGKDAIQKQQATMALYRQTGVNPFAGCIPVLLQMPILYAMFRFFPAEIVLRGKSFLWADDLAAYDSIFSWSQHIPILSDIYGNHVSGFTLLMCVSTFLYTRMSMSAQPQMTQQPGMPNMKVMMNLFTIMMLFFFNNQPSGLSMYYFIANMVSIGQMWAIKKYFIDENAIRAKIESNKAKPKTKSGFMQRLEEAQKMQKAKLAENNRKK